jgi:hypothetical protein
MRRLLLTLVAVIVTGCSTAGGSTERPTTGPSTESPTAGGSTARPTAGPSTERPTVSPEPSPTVEAPVSVTGDPVTGASDTFALGGGPHEVAWTTTADTAGCYFSLLLTTKIDGPTVKSDVKLLPVAKSYSGTFLWLLVQAGTYVLQEDRTGFGHCKGPWSATITPR